MNIQQGFQLHQAKRFWEAEAIYVQLLNASPNDATARHYLGLVMHHQGRTQEGLPHLEQSVREAPTMPLFSVNLGAVYRALGQYEKAVGSYQAALQLDPTLAAIHHNLGNLYRDMNKWEEAQASYREAIKLNPDYVEATVHLAAAISELGRQEEALALLDEAMAKHEKHANVHRQRAVVLGRLYRHEESEAAARKAIELDPGDAEAWNSLGIVLQLKGKLDEAKKAFFEAVNRNNGYADALTNLGMLHLDLREFKQAAQILTMATKVNPNMAMAYAGLASVYHQTSHLTLAIESGKRAVALNKRLTPAYFAVAGAYLDRAQIKDAAGWYERAWSIDANLNEHGSGVLLCLHYDGRLSPQKVSEAHFEWGRRISTIRPPNPPAPDPAAGISRRLRVGYLSPDFREHSVAYFAEPLLANHDREKFEIHAFAHLASGDKVTERFKAIVDHWHDVRPLNDQQLDELIRSLGIDIMVDLAGHTSGSRLLALLRKPSCLNFNYLGYPNTIGSNAFDYRLTDRWADPPGMTDSLHSERLVRLDRPAWCYQASAIAPAVAPPRNGGPVVFASFNNYSKTSDQTVKLWTKIVKHVPGSILKLKGKTFGDPDTVKIVRSRFEFAGLPADRLVLLPSSPTTEAHLAEYAQVDIGLDPFPYNGTTTTCEAFWMGVPVVALAGKSHLSRVGVSLLNAMGLRDLVAPNEEQYVEIAVRLAKDPERLAFLRSELRQVMQRSELTNAISLARAVEAAYAEAWKTLIK